MEKSMEFMTTMTQWKMAKMDTLPMAIPLKISKSAPTKLTYSMRKAQMSLPFSVQPNRSRRNPLKYSRIGVDESRLPRSYSTSKRFSLGKSQNISSLLLQENPSSVSSASRANRGTYAAISTILTYSSTIM